MGKTKRRRKRRRRNPQRTTPKMMTRRKVRVKQSYWLMRLGRVRELVFTTLCLEQWASSVWRLWWSLLDDEHSQPRKSIWSCGHSEDDQVAMLFFGRICPCVLLYYREPRGSAPCKA